MPCCPGRPYAALIHTKSASVTITHIKHRLDINTGAHLAAKTLGLNEIATVNVSFDRSVPFAPYAENKRLGAFIVIDKLTNETVGAGLIRFALRRAVNVHWQALEVTKGARAEMKHQRGALSVVHRAFGFGQIDDRQPAGKTSACRRQAHLHSRRRQCSPRAQSGSWDSPKPTASKTFAESARSRSFWWTRD